MKQDGRYGFGKAARTAVMMLLALCIFFGVVFALAGCGGSEDEPAAPEESGYKIACLGDSITAGFGLEDGEKCYSDIMAEDEDIASVQNLGSPGAFIGYSSSDEYNPLDLLSFLRRYNKVEEGTDLIFVFGGTNDYGGDGCDPLGEMGDTEQDTFYGALYILINGLKETYPDAQLLFATPLQRDDVWVGSPETTPYNEKGYTLADYRQAIIDMCTEYSIDYVDLYNLEGMRLEDETFESYFLDGLHPNAAGHQVLANTLLPRIKSMLAA